MLYDQGKNDDGKMELEWGILTVKWKTALTKEISFLVGC